MSYITRIATKRILAKYFLYSLKINYLHWKLSASRSVFSCYATNTFKKGIGVNMAAFVPINYQFFTNFPPHHIDFLNSLDNMPTRFTHATMRICPGVGRCWSLWCSHSTKEGTIPFQMPIFVTLMARANWPHSWGTRVSCSRLHYNLLLGGGGRCDPIQLLEFSCWQLWGSFLFSCCRHLPFSAFLIFFSSSLSSARASVSYLDTTAQPSSDLSAILMCFCLRANN